MKKNNGYKINFANNTITINYTFAAAANQPGTDEYDILKRIREDFPQMRTIIKSGRTQKAPKKNKGLTYEHMRVHISAYNNAEELLEMFDKVVELSATARSPYKYVSDWFKAQFPHYNEIPDFKKNELTVIPLQPKENTSEDLALAK